MNRLYVPDRRLHLPPPSKAELAAVKMLGGLVEIGVWDATGKLVYQKREPSRSPVKQFLQTLLSLMKGTDMAGVQDTGNTTRTLDESEFATCLDCGAPLNNDDYGIVVGTGSTAVDITDYALETQVVDGSAAGQMVYNAMVLDAAVTVADPNCTFELYRNFNNNSGGSITIRETGIYVLTKYTTNQIGYFCIVHDIPTQVAVSDGGGCYVLYTLKITE